MALIKCKSCGKEISDKAASCPKCGYHTKNNMNDEQKQIIIVFGISIGITIISTIVMVMMFTFKKPILTSNLMFIFLNGLMLWISLSKMKGNGNTIPIAYFMLVLTIIYVLIFGIIIKKIDDDYKEKKEDIVNDAVKEFACETHYDDGRWINEKCYYTDRNGRVRTTENP